MEPAAEATAAASSGESAGEGAKEEHRCDVCEKSFGSKAGLAGHLKFSEKHQQLDARLRQTEATARVLAAAGESFERASTASQPCSSVQEKDAPPSSAGGSAPPSSATSAAAAAAMAADEAAAAASPPAAAEAAAPAEKRRRISGKSSSRNSEKLEAESPEEVQKDAPATTAASAAPAAPAPSARGAGSEGDEQRPAAAAEGTEEGRAAGAGDEERAPQGAAAAAAAAEGGEAAEATAAVAAVRKADQFEKFRPATDHEIELFPSVCAAFEVYLRTVDAKINDTTRRCYPGAIQTLFRLDGKPPEVMATDEYRAAVKHTLEDRACSHIQSSSLRYFGQFWDAEGKEFASSGVFPPEVTEDLKGRFQKFCHPMARIRLEEDGDSSEEARKAESLPEGWRVHSTSGGRILGYSSPEGFLYTSRAAVRQLFEEAAGETPAPKSRRRGPAFGEVEDADDPEGQTPEKPVVDPKPLMELLGPATESDGAGAQDRQLLARIISTFSRRMREHRADTQRQSTRDTYVLAVFKLFSQTGRGFHAMAQQPFLDAVAGSEEARKNKALNTAVRTFSRFWADIGGYGGSFDEADRDSMNLALNVKPILVDGNGLCCAPMHGGRSCTRPNQQCVTCGTKLKCCSHGDHSVLECREIFWAKHSRHGTRQRTMADFWKGQSAASSQEVQDVEMVSMET